MPLHTPLRSVLLFSLLTSMVTSGILIACNPAPEAPEISSSSQPLAPLPQNRSPVATAEDWQAQMDAAIQLYEQGDLAAAYEAFQRLAAQHPDQSEFFLYMGYIKQQKGDAFQSEAHYSAAIAMNPNQPDAYTRRANLLATQGNSLRAMADLNQSLSLNPDQVEARQLRGSLYLEQANYSSALADFDVAIRLDRQQPDLHRGRATALEALNRGPEAADSLETYLQLSVGDAEADVADRAELFNRIIDLRRN